MASSPPSTPVISKTRGSKRVIPDTPGSPPVQVLASSPAPNGAATTKGVSTKAPISRPGIANGQNVRTNSTVTAVAEAMKLANPQFATGGSIRHPVFPSQIPPSPQSIIPQSPPKPQFGEYVSQFSYNPTLLQAPVPHTSAPPYRLAPVSMANAYSMPNRPRPILARPIQTVPPPHGGGGGPQLDYRPVAGTPLRRLVDMFPHITEIQGINALTACRGNFEDAAARISENPTFGVNPFPHPQPQPMVHHQQPLPNYGLPPSVSFQSTTKRTLKAPNQTIQQKYTHLNQSFIPNTFPYNLAPRPLAPIAPFSGPPSALTQFSVSPSRPVQSKKRKLVRGGSKLLDSDGDSMSSEDEDEEPVYRDEVFDEKVLDFLNTASPEEISDVTFTPLEQVIVFISNRPFGSLEHSRTIELPPSEDDDEPAKKKGKGRRTVKKGRNIGNRIVDGAEEVLAGYNGVDDLISECETIGKRVREKLSKWMTSAKEIEEGALTLTSLSPSTPSTMTTDPSPAPSDRVDPDFMMGQPTSLAENVSLKDYQLIGVNWFHLLYKEGLSCILADEMGLGKTCQVIAFLGGLLERTGGQRGKHLVVVPSSTIGMTLPCI
jgi:SNF2-related domain